MATEVDLELSDCTKIHVITSKMYLFSDMRLLRSTEVQIGFDPDSYTVNEGAGTVTLTARVISGSLERDVEIEFSTADDTAMGEDEFMYVLVN